PIYARLLLLIDRALADTVSAAERDELQALLTDVSHEDTVIQVLEDRWKVVASKTSVFAKEEGQEILQRILEGSENGRSSDRGMRKLFPWFKIVAVALLTVAVWGMIDFYFGDCESNELTIEQAVAQS